MCGLGEQTNCSTPVTASWQTTSCHRCSIMFNWPFGTSLRSVIGRPNQKGNSTVLLRTGVNITHSNWGRLQNAQEVSLDGSLLDLWNKFGTNHATCPTCPNLTACSLFSPAEQGACAHFVDHVHENMSGLSKSIKWSGVVAHGVHTLRKHD